MNEKVETMVNASRYKEFKMTKSITRSRFDSKRSQPLGISLLKL